jgi:hypothetical protein
MMAERQVAQNAIKELDYQQRRQQEEKYRRSLPMKDRMAYDTRKNAEIAKQGEGPLLFLGILFVIGLILKIFGSLK